MNVKISQIRHYLEKALIARGLSLQDAKTVAEEYLEGELQGKISHGLMAFPSLLAKISKTSKSIKVVKKTPSLLVIDARKIPGAIVAEQTIDMLIKIAKKQGLAGALIKNMIVWLRPGTVAQKIAAKDYIGLVVNNGGRPMVAPPGGYDPVIATNPIGIGIPTAKEPILIDMATSKKAWGEVRKAEAAGTNLPPQTYYDCQGNFAVKPDQAYSALPLGDYKGFALGLFIEIITGSLVNMVMGVHKLKGDYRTLPRGAFILVINPRLSTSLNKFKLTNSKLIKEIKQSHKLKSVKEIFIPGERAAAIKKQNLQRGYLTIKEELWQQLIS